MLLPDRFNGTERWMVMGMDEYSKCEFCTYYDNYDGCTNWFCCGKNAYEPDKQRIIEKSKESGLSVADIVALINLG